MINAKEAKRKSLIAKREILENLIELAVYSS